MSDASESASGEDQFPLPEVDVGPLRRAARGGPTIVAGVAIGTLGVAVWNFKRDLPRWGSELGPVVGALLGITLSLVLLALAVRLVHSDLPPRQRWWVAAGCLGGAILAGALIFLTLAIRLTEGGHVGDPLFILVMNATTGGIAGTLVGFLYARVSTEAERADRARSQLAFLNDVVSHDVRNGISVVQARAELLQRQGDADGVEAILDQSESLEGLLDRTRAIIAALNDGGDRIGTEPVPLADAVEPSLAAIRGSHPDATVRASLPDDVAVEANDLLADVIGNLVTNAIEHNDTASPTVSVSASVDGDLVSLQVADDGPGIPPAEQETLFERSDQGAGGGFGLFFVRTMVSQWGGRVWLTGNDTRGSVFHLELRRA